MEVIPIGILKLIDNGVIDHKIIAIPIDESKQIIKTPTFKAFSIKFPKVKRIVELWFLNYNKDEEVSIEGWGDEKEAIEQIINNKK